MPTVLRNGQWINMTADEYNNETRRKSAELGLSLTDNGYLKGADTAELFPDGKIYDMGFFFIDNEPFSGFSGFTSVNTKTYFEEPQRTGNGSIPDINDYETFVVPRVRFNFKYFSLDDYQRLCEAILPNEFVVKYYDKQFGKWVSHKMYCEPEEMTKIYNVDTTIIGVLDYEISLIGTCNPLDTYNFVYGNLRPTEINTYVQGAAYSINDKVQLGGVYYVAIKDNPTSFPPPNSEYWGVLTGWSYDGVSGTAISWGTSVKLVSPSTINSGTQYTVWNTKADGTGRIYYPNQSVIIFDNLTLYPR